jgi:outer membrane protein
MRRLVVGAVYGLLFSVAPAFAQAPAQSATPPVAGTPAPPAPFPQGAKVAFVNLQIVAAESVEGRAAQTKVAALTTEKQNQIAERTKAFQGQQQKLQTSGGVMSEQARLQLERDIERQGVDLERFQQDAQSELSQLQQELQAEFERNLFPILQRLSAEKGLHLLFSAADAGLIWAAEGLDLTAEAIKALDAGAAPAAAPPQP